jgi:hypothetical protein
MASERASTSRVGLNQRRGIPIDIVRSLVTRSGDSSDEEFSSDRDGSETEDEVIEDFRTISIADNSPAVVGSSSHGEVEDMDDMDELQPADAEHAENREEETGNRPTDQLEVLNVPKNLYGKNHYKWSGSIPSSRTRIARRNIIVGEPGNVGVATGVSSSISAWSLFFTDEILNGIVRYTNVKIAEQRVRYRSDRPQEDDDDDTGGSVRPSFARDVNVVELKALFGLYYLSGVMNMNHVTVRELFDKDTGVAYFRATMSQARFEFLTNCIRFDDATTRGQRRQDDRFAPIRSLFEHIVNRSEHLYIPSEYCTVDEQLLAFRGRCPFKMYIPSKPDKYGIKIIMMCDAKTFYMSNAKVYTGKGSTPPGIPVAQYYSIQLTSPIHGTNRNCTFDNWFTSIPTARMLLEDHSVTMVGTMKSNKVEIPPSFIETHGRKKNTAMFAFSGAQTLLSYMPPKSTKKKIVMMLSTMHKDADKTDTVNIPEIVEFYNATKCGVDTFDQLSHRYSVSRKTRRWPLCVFYGLLNATGINSMILLVGSGVQDKEEVPNRRTYLKTLAKALIFPHLEARLAGSTLPKSLRETIRRILNLEPEPHVQPQQQAGVGRCAFCPRSHDRKSRTMCSLCQKFICGDHQHKVCPDCAAE